MAWDFRLDPLTHDLAPGYVTGPDEIIQRLKVRLWRDLGEWFLDRSAGLPWYDAGEPGTQGIFGSSDMREAELLIRREVLDTDGVLRIVSMNTRQSGRALSFYLEVLIDGGSVQSFTLERNFYGRNV